MSNKNCAKDQLSLLICDQLSSEDTNRLMKHLETCSACQAELESLSAHNFWWERAKRGLSGAEVDEQNRLLEPETANCSIETFLEGESEGNPDDPLYSSQAVLAILDPPSHPEMLGRIDEFEIEEKIGQGGMGIVFRGFDHSLNRPVAIKIMSPHLGANATARQRFAREARAAAAVVHPNVVPIYRVSTTKDCPYIAMALADGCSLQEYVTTHGPFDVKDVIRIVIQVAGGLAAAHKQGLIHRDIKPANVLMEKDVSRIMITDFGLARAVDDVMMTQSGCLAGTPNYMSPEQVIGHELDHRSDLFSLGSLMYFIATGCEPFQSESAFAVINKITRDFPKSARQMNSDIPEVLDRIIQRLHEKDREHRIRSAEELESLLTQVLAHLQEPNQHTLPAVKLTTVQRRRNRRRIVLGIAIAGLIIAAIAGFKFWGAMEWESNHGRENESHGQRDGDEHNQKGKNGEEEQHN